MYRHYRSNDHGFIQYQEYQIVETHRQVPNTNQNDLTGLYVFLSLMVVAVVTGVVFFVNQSVDSSSYYEQEYKKPEKKRSKHTMPKIFRWAIYAAIVKLVWMAVDNAPLIAQFISNKI